MGAGMGRLHYLVAKYMPDVMREEPRNIGVIVYGSSGVAARFYGEVGAQPPVGAPVGLFNDVELFYEWRKAWRRRLTTFNPNQLEDFIAAMVTDRGAYSVWPGGEYFTEQDPQGAADQLFERLVVDPSQLAQVGDSVRGDEARRRGGFLAVDIRKELRRLNVLASPALEKRKTQDAFIRHPVVERPSLAGTLDVPHVPTFYQQNGRRYVMEHVDFTLRNTSTSREHAAYTAFMFGDLFERAKQDKDEHSLTLIAIVQRTTSKQAQANQRYGLAAISAQPTARIVHWDETDERESFLKERLRIASTVE
jgi:hypothetical protein